jgi:hypothetical protein
MQLLEVEELDVVVNPSGTGAGMGWVFARQVGKYS